jgi:hypothetical protein
MERGREQETDMNDDLDEENMINMAKSEEQEGEGSAES